VNTGVFKQVIGTTLGRYDIQEELGQGGMSVVYHGRDRSLGRDVAVKVLHNHLAKKPENRERFHREARAIARLKHTNILEIYDYAQADEEHAFIVMEYVAGVNLGEFINAHGPMPAEYAALVGLELCHALAHAHEQGIIHRDLKPENVMVSTAGTIKLMDFGIAHIFDAETMTQTGSLLGSPAHMAPELIEGEPVDVRADVFALGTVLYWLVCGRLPFEGKNAPQILKRVMEGVYKRPDALDPRIGQAMSEVIARCMAHRAEDRYPNVYEARDALEQLLVGAPLLSDDALAAYLTDPEPCAEAWSARVLPWMVSRGCAAMQAGETGEALRCFNRALGYDPRDPQVCAALERLHKPRGRTAMALAACGALALAAGGIWSVAHTTPDQPTPEVATRPRPAPSPAPTPIPIPAIEPAVLEQAHTAAQRATQLASASSLAQIAALTQENAITRDARRITSLLSLIARVRRREALQGKAPVEEPVDPIIPVEEPAAPTEYTYRFNVLPRAASLVIQNRKYTALDALQGIKLVPGVHTVRAESVGCQPLVTRMDLSRPPSPEAAPRDMVMQWQDGLIQVQSDFDVFVWLNDAPQPTQLIQAKKTTTLRIPFGAASLDSPRKTIRMRISRKNDLLRTRQEVFTLSPGAQHIVAVNAASLP
jgi:eukaryotic-like serine/threonine-protein kinase